MSYTTQEEQVKFHFNKGTFAHLESGYAKYGFYFLFFISLKKYVLSQHQQWSDELLGGLWREKGKREYVCAKSGLEQSSSGRWDTTNDGSQAYQYHWVQLLKHSRIRLLLVMKCFLCQRPLSLYHRCISISDVMKNTLNNKKETKGTKPGRKTWVLET